ncbi:hypothetical protein [Nevskia soli]|uniref:hypothetical protein n=1 Tax=Nevskia soli TaxID=418856 RepID=UPI0012FC6568|nr:hypothetical protein [Nevskia soli]
MTIIAAYTVEGCPILIGDLLISGIERIDRKHSVPMIGGVENIFPAGSGWSIIGLRQKIEILNATTAIAWAGSYIAARIVIKELKLLASENKLSFSKIKDYFSSLDPDIVKQGVSFIGWTLEKDLFKTFEFNTKNRLSTSLIGTVVATGTGAEAFVKSLSNIPLNSFKATGKINSLATAISTSLFTTGLMLRAEASAASSSSLLGFFGGGYELATFFDGRFQKIGNVTYVFWEARISNLGVTISSPLLALKQEYFNEILLIHSIEFGNHSTQERQITRNDYHAVLPVYAAASEIDLQLLKPTSLNSRFTCHYFGISINGNYEILCKLDHRIDDATRDILFIEENGQVTVKVAQDFLTHIAEEITKKAQKS